MSLQKRAAGSSSSSAGSTTTSGTSSSASCFRSPRDKPRESAASGCLILERASELASCRGPTERFRPSFARQPRVSRRLPSVSRIAHKPLPYNDSQSTWRLFRPPGVAERRASQPGKDPPPKKKTEKRRDIPPSLHPSILLDARKDKNKQRENDGRRDRETNMTDKNSRPWGGGGSGRTPLAFPSPRILPLLSESACSCCDWYPTEVSTRRDETRREGVGGSTGRPEEAGGGNKKKMSAQFLSSL